MNRSQLRGLAREYAADRLEYGDYVRERGEIIDGIVCGDISIESPVESMADLAAAQSLNLRSRYTALPMIIGACVVIGVIWLLFAPSEPTPPDKAQQSASERQSGKRASTARVLVDDFLATRDWSGKGLAEFRDSWNALPPNEQAAARAAPWFRRLAEALNDEINAHKALAEFDDSGLSSATGRRLIGFAELLGIDAEMPDPPIAERQVTPTAQEKPLSASQWLAAQRGEDYTLQLFAVNHLDRLEHLTASHPDVPLYLLTFTAKEPRYRMLHGAFRSEEQARLAHETLPAELRAESSIAFIRRVSELREELRGGGNSNSTSKAKPAPDAPPVYTLQLIASTNRENVDRLVARYHSLDLRVYTSEAETSRYRVLYGRFDSPQAAQEASAKLPASMLEALGTPLLRETTEFP